MRIMIPPSHRTFAAWWRGGATGGKVSSSHHIPPTTNTMVMMDVSKKRHYPVTIVNEEYRLSICSIQGYREYMEDEFMIHSTTTSTNHNKNINTTDNNTTDNCITKNDDSYVTSDGIVACFDGHGGKAVSRYLRQNLYTNLQAALRMIQQTKAIPTMTSSSSMDGEPNTVDDDDEEDDDDDDDIDHDSSTNSALECHRRNDEGHPNTHHHVDDNNINNLKTLDDTYLVSGLPSTTTILPTTSSSSTITHSGTLSRSSVPQSPTRNTTTTASVDDYVSALEVALDKVDREVLKIKHWRHQGSTAIVCWIHTAIIQTTNTSNQEPNITAEHARVGNESEELLVVDKNPIMEDQPTTSVVRTLITANIGDSRAILCRNGVAIALSRDHKPNDPIEYQRIQQLGGTVVWDGEVDRMREPIPGMGCYRVNGNLALSRVIGDRSDRPVVNSDPDITLITLVVPEDEFIVVATDGLWDVMSSSDTVAFIRALLDNVEHDAIDRDSIATYVVEEALRRGSDDNITVIIVWLK